jgi:hypothetical protein
VTNRELGFDSDDIGLSGSRTRVAAAYTKELPQKESIFVAADDAGAEVVRGFFESKGFI